MGGDGGAMDFSCGGSMTGSNLDSVSTAAQTKRSLLLAN